MKIFKGFKLIFSRLFLVGLAVILQVTLLSYFIFDLTQSYFYFQVSEAVFGFLAFIAINNSKKIHPEHKILWVILLLVIPFVGITLYILFMINTPSKKIIKKYTTYDKKIISKSNEYQREIKSISNKYYGQIKYIESMSSLTCCKNTKCTYFYDGMHFYESLLNDLKNATKFILMEYFIINNGKMWNGILDILKEKVKEGVEVKFLYDDLGSCRYVSGNYYKYLRKLGIKCYKFNPMIPLVSSYHNNRDHRKITIIDGKIAYTGGINISDEYINLTHPYGYWKDNAVRLEGEAANNLTILFLQLYGVASRTKQDFEYYMNKDNDIVSDEIIMPYGTGPKNFYYENMATDIFLNMISQAQHSIDISTPYLIIDYALTNALIAASKRGVRVRILIPSKPDKKLIYAFTKQAALQLLSNGVEIYTYTPGFNHAKSFLVDNKIAFVGTTNLDFRSLIHHYECGVYIYNSPCIKEIDINFEKDYLKSKKVAQKDFKNKLITTIIVSFLKIFQSLL